MNSAKERSKSVCVGNDRHVDEEAGSELSDKHIGQSETATTGY